MKTRIQIWFVLAGLGALVLIGCTEQEDPGAGNEVTEEAVQEEVIADRDPAETPAADCHLTMGWDPWEPYQYRDPKGKVSGLDIDLVNAAAEMAGCEISFRQEDFADLLRMIRDGEVDIVAGATMTDERTEYARFSAPYRRETFSLFVRQSDARVFEDASLKDLLDDGRRIGITEGFLYGDDAEALIANEDYAGQFTTARVGEINLFRLIERDIDALLEDPFVAISIQRRLGLSDQIARVGDDIRTGEVHLMFSRESVAEGTVTRIDEALQELIEDGTRDRVLEMYVTE